MDVLLSFLEVCVVYYLEHQGSLWICFLQQRNREFEVKYFKKLLHTNNILCLQEVHGKDEYLQAVQVFVRDLGFYENAGGSAICIRTNSLEEALVSFSIT